MANERLDEEALERAFRHGFDARERFADRPFDEVETWLQESWQAAHEEEWDRVAPVVRGGYERYKGAGLDQAADLAPETLHRYPDRTVAGSVTRPSPARPGEMETDH